MVFRWAAFFALASGSWARPTVTVAPVDPSLAGMSLIGPSDSGYQAAVGALVQASDVADLAAVRPYSVVLVNNTGRNVFTYVVRFDYTAPQGRTGNQRVGSSQMPPNPKPLIAAGKQALITIRGQYTGTGGGAGSVVLKLRPNEYYQTAVNMTISLDSVLFDDGLFVGPDRSGQFARDTAALSAHVAFYKAVPAFQGQDPSQLAQYLSSLAPAASRQADAGLNPGPYMHVLSSNAGGYQMLLARKGAAAVFSNAQINYDVVSAYQLHRQGN
jgi:hypothetical protein